MRVDHRGAASFGDGRIVGLDAWRALLMLGGIFVHASAGLPSRPLFVVVADASQAFRMGMFFAISGFLAALALARHDPGGWLRRRLRELGIPALFGVGLLSPLIWALHVTGPAAAGAPPPMPFEWHHLWFLFGLMAYSSVGVALHVADRRWHVLQRIDRAMVAASGRTAVLVVAIASAFLFAVVTPLLLCLPPAWVRGFGHVQMIAGYLPMFVFGFALARLERLRERVVAATRFAWIVIVAAILAYAATRLDGGAARFGEQASFLAAALCPPAMLVLVLRSALAIRRVPAVMHQLADASYTIYIVHVPIGIAINTRLAGAVEPHLAYMLTVTAAAGASYAIHMLLVRRFSLAALLLNGRRRPRHPAGLVPDHVLRPMGPALG